MELRKLTRIGWGRKKELTGFRVVSVDRDVYTMEPKAITFGAENIIITLTKEEIETLYERIQSGQSLRA